MRLAIFGCALGYLLLSRPWSEPDRSMAMGTYMCPLAFSILALIPNRTRLWIAICAAIAVPLLVEIAMDVIQSS